MRLKLKIVSIIIIASFWSSTAFSFFYFDLHASAGSGSAKVKDESESPKVMQYGLGTTVGVNVGVIAFLGVSYDYYQVAQTSEFKETYGNRKGTRINMLSPTIGVSLGGLTLKFDYQLSGEYKLDKKTSSGQALKYIDPSGYRAYIGYDVGFIPIANTEIGLFYESVEYGKEVIDSSESELTNKLTVSQVGLMLTVGF